MNIQNYDYSQLTEPAQLREAAVFFRGWQETMIWSALQNIQGRVFADTSEKPSSAAVVLGDFCFLAGWTNKDQAYLPAGKINEDTE